MIRSGICNSHLLALLARVRHTNTLVIADCMFPHWPGLIEIDLSVVRGLPTVPQLASAILAHWKGGAVWMASEFLEHNAAPVVDEFQTAFAPLTISFEPHTTLKARVPGALGLIRTGEDRIYTNVVLESA